MHMNRLLLLLLFLSYETFSCEVFPMDNVVKSHKSFYENSDVVFLGTLKSQEINEHEQVAIFVIEKKFKSKNVLGKEITLKNRLLSTCSYAIEPVGKSFYVFAKITEFGEYTLDDYASFVPLSYAQNNDMVLE